MTDMRYDPLRETWTVFSRGRAMRPPWLEGHANGSGATFGNPFARGSEHLTPQPLLVEQEPGDAGQWQIRVVPNRAPLLKVEGQPGSQAAGCYDRMDGLGAHELFIEDAGSRSLEELDLPQIGRVIHAWKHRIQDLMKDSRMRHFTIFRNQGLQAGSYVDHSVSQLTASAIVPPAIKQRLKVARRFYEQKQRSIFEDLLREEVRAGLRVVYENSGFLLFCPYASRAPFEQAIYPKRQSPDFHTAGDQETAQLADVLKVALCGMKEVLGRAPYNLMLFTAPVRTARRDHWNTIDLDFRWHIEIVPRIFPEGGFEAVTGFHTNTVVPEEAAGYLRKSTARA